MIKKILEKEKMKYYQNPQNTAKNVAKETKNNLLGVLSLELGTKSTVESWTFYYLTIAQASTGGNTCDKLMNFLRTKKEMLWSHTYISKQKGGKYMW